MLKLFFLILILISPRGFANTNFEGFFAPEDLPQLPLKYLEKSVYKIEIAPRMHGTAFSISDELLITNAHNITQCLRDHGYTDTGYDGAKGPLDCKSLSIILPDSSKVKGVQLLGSNARYNNDGWDFAIIKLSGLNAKPVDFSLGGMPIGESVFVAGFPGSTFRSKSSITNKLNQFVDLFDALFEAQEKLSTINPQESTSQEIFQTWVQHGFSRLQPLVVWSEYLSGSLLGNSWDPLLAWQSESPLIYLQNLNDHLEKFKKDSFILLNMAEKGLLGAVDSYPDADGELKISNATFHRDAGVGIKILKGDGTPGSSGSMVFDKKGLVVGIVSQVRGLEPDSKKFCSLDAMMTSFESINFKYCPHLGLSIVSSDTILTKLSDWGIKLP